jgi:hypothetical protein
MGRLDLLLETCRLIQRLPFLVLKRNKQPGMPLGEMTFVGAFTATNSLAVT